MSEDWDIGDENLEKIEKPLFKVKRRLESLMEVLEDLPSEMSKVHEEMMVETLMEVVTEIHQKLNLDITPVHDEDETTIIDIVIETRIRETKFGFLEDFYFDRRDIDHTKGKIFLSELLARSWTQTGHAKKDIASAFSYILENYNEPDPD